MIGIHVANQKPLISSQKGLVQADKDIGPGHVYLGNLLHVQYAINAIRHFGLDNVCQSVGRSEEDWPLEFKNLNGIFILGQICNLLPVSDFIGTDLIHGVLPTNHRRSRLDDEISRGNGKSDNHGGNQVYADGNNCDNNIRRQYGKNVSPYFTRFAECQE